MDQIQTCISEGSLNVESRKTGKENTSWSHLVYPPAPGRIIYTYIIHDRCLSNMFLKTSKDGNSNILLSC